MDFRRGEKAKLTEATRLREDYKFSIEDFTKMFSVADLEEKYVLCAGKSFGLRAGDFLRLTRGDLEPYISREVPISIGEYNTEKEGVKAFPHIDADTQPVIKLMLEKLTREGRTGQEERILTFGNEIQLSRVLKRITENAGINVGNKQVRFHCLRKFLIDHLSSYMSESKWKQIVGKKISESAYVSPDSLREDYQRAMSETTLSKTASGDMEMVVKKQIALQTLKNLGISESDVKKLFKRKPANLAEEIEEIEKLLAEKSHQETNGGTCADGKNCGEENFKQIAEAELLEHLKAGWKITHNLANGQVIIQR